MRGSATIDPCHSNALIADASVQLKNDVASHKVTLPKIKDDEASYTFSYSIEAGGETHDGDVDYCVFPKKVELEAVDKDSKAFPNVEFKLIEGTAEKKLHCDKSGKASLQLKDAGEFKIDAVAPFLLDSWMAETGHERKAQFSRTPYKAAFHSHRHDFQEGTAKIDLLTQRGSAAFAHLRHRRA